MGLFSIGCQTYSWEMLGEEWKGTTDEILDAIAEGGYSGVEFSNHMIGSYVDQPDKFEAALEKRNLRCAAFAYARNGFTDPAEFMIDLDGLDQALRFASFFKIVLGLGGPSSPTRQNIQSKLSQAVKFYQEAAGRAEKYGVTLAIHPHSHHTSLALSAEEYEFLLKAIEPYGIQFNPDTGHILRGGQELMDCLTRYQDRIVHVHIKDVDKENQWAMLGEGITPLLPLLRWLEEINYSGWVIIEEESNRARVDVNQAIARDRNYLKSLGY
jgi:sugar phosphate isomerase/epimerase